MQAIDKDGVFLPQEIWEDRTLTIQEKFAYSFIKNDSLGDINRKKIQAHLNLSASRVKRIISSLEDKGYIDLRTPKNGFVYVFSNPCLDGLLKIGMTGRSAQERADELYADSSIPDRFTVEYSFYSKNAMKLERLVHERLSGSRHSKEFFRCSVDDAVSAINLASRNEKAAK